MPNAPLSIWVDASDFAVGGALAQYHDDVWQPLAWQLIHEIVSQKNWSTYDRELLAIYTMVKRFRHMLEGREFVIYTDQKPLIYAFQQKADKYIILTCDVSTNVSRPFIPKDYRKIVFQHLHGLSHPGIAASTTLVTQRFVWPNIRRDIKAWVNSCHPCQRSKIHRHTKAPIGTFALPDARFFQIHIDFIGPFPPSNGQSYCLIVVDRFTR
ncbi:transposon Tf2-9 polyprotein [Trichonephila clavipes]|nr:transposon Tf2-9 polyprotein [Trichonephila clavipes]